jgi:hypothetical protein
MTLPSNVDTGGSHGSVGPWGFEPPSPFAVKNNLDSAITISLMDGSWNPNGIEAAVCRCWGT